MTSAVSVSKLFSKAKITSYLSGNASTAKDITWVDMKDYEGFAVIATAAALTGVGVTVLTIVANSNSAGTGDEVVIKAHAVGTAPDAAGDMLVIECTAAEIAHLGRASGYALRYVSAKVTCASASDNIVVTYILHSPKFPQDALTADVTA